MRIDMTWLSRWFFLVSGIAVGLLASKVLWLGLIHLPHP